MILATNDVEAIECSRHSSYGYSTQYSLLSCPSFFVKENEATDTCCCAACGISEIDDIKLVPSDDCDLVRYCSDECQTNHRSEHEEACKKRAAAIRDELLFKQPESSYLGDCPICSLPMPLDDRKLSCMNAAAKLLWWLLLYQSEARE